MRVHHYPINLKERKNNRNIIKKKRHKNAIRQKLNNLAMEHFEDAKTYALENNTKYIIDHYDDFVYHLVEFHHQQSKKTKSTNHELRFCHTIEFLERTKVDFDEIIRDFAHSVINNLPVEYLKNVLNIEIKDPRTKESQTKINSIKNQSPEKKYLISLHNSGLIEFESKI